MIGKLHRKLTANIFFRFFRNTIIRLHTMEPLWEFVEEYSKDKKDVSLRTQQKNFAQNACFPYLRLLIREIQITYNYE